MPPSPTKSHIHTRSGLFSPSPSLYPLQPLTFTSLHPPSFSYHLPTPAWVRSACRAGGVLAGEEEMLGLKSMRSVIVGWSGSWSLARRECSVDVGARSMVVVVYGCQVEELSSKSARIGCTCGSRLSRSWGLSELGSWEKKYTCLNRKHCLM